MLKRYDSENNLAVNLSDYLRYQYPNVLFRFDYGAGLRITPGQAVRQKRLQKAKSWPDLFIAEPRGKYGGLFIEIKRHDTKVYLKNGTLTSNPHIQRQAGIINELIKRGYKAEFGIGFDHCKDIIDSYLQTDNNLVF